MRLFQKKDSTISNLTNITPNTFIFRSILNLQNEINTSYESKVVGIIPLEDDCNEIALSKAFFDVYNYNNLKTILVDLNMSNPQLQSVLSNKMVGFDNLLISQQEIRLENNHLLRFFSYNQDIIFFSKNPYPSNFFKSVDMECFIRYLSSHYQHTILLLPNIKDNKEIKFIAKMLSCVLIVVKKNVSKRENLYNALAFCKAENIPLAKVIVLK